MSESEIKLGKIEADFEWEKQGRLVWQKDNLSEVAKRARLRSDIVIQKGDALPRAQTTQLSNVLAWRGIFDPESSVQSAPTEPEMELSYDWSEGKHTICINEQGLIFNLNHTNQVLSDDRLIRRVDELSRIGLKKVLAQEKYYQTLLSSMVAGLLTISSLTGAGLFTFSVKTGLDTLDTQQLPSYIPLIVENNPVTPNIFASMEFGAAAFIALVSARSLIKLPKVLFEDQSASYLRYLSSKEDLNPFIHTRDYLRGRSYLNNPTNRLAVYER